MLILGLETSTDVCSVGLVEDTGNEQEITRVESRIHSEKLLTMVEELFARGGRMLDESSAIAVSMGPGSFTGLRIGLSAAKGLCYALGRQLIAIPTFDALALKAFDMVRTDALLIAADAKQGEYYVQLFVRDAGKFLPAHPVRIVSFDDVARGVTESPACAVATDSERVAAIVQGKERVLHLPSLCSGVAVARLGLARFLAKEFADVASVEPMYLKDFVVRFRQQGP